MQVMIRGRIYNSENEPIVIIWDTDQERKASASHISNMEDRDGVRMYASYPDTLGSVECTKLMARAEDLLLNP